MSKTITVLIATANRCLLLENTLDSIISQGKPAGYSVEIVVADNGSGSDTADLIQNRWSNSVRYLACEEGSRSRAINTALRKITGDIVVFTDDDVTPSSGWLSEIVSAFSEDRRRILVCGPIHPQLPAACPEWLEHTPAGGVAYARFEPPIPRGALPLELIPFGPNFAVRRAALKGLWYREDLGPSRNNGPLSCDDLAFLQELRTRYMPLVQDGGFFYAPDAGVAHRVRPEQLKLDWIFDRFFHYGRSMVALTRQLTYFSSPSRLRNIPSGLHPFLAEERSMELSYILGQLRQLRILGQEENFSFVFEWLKYSGALTLPVELGSIGRNERSALIERPVSSFVRQ